MKTHDYSGAHRYWGHDYCITEVYASGNVLDATGWGGGIAAGDFLLLDDHTAPHRNTRYKVKTIAYERDPRDMWTATLEFAPRPRPQVA